MASGEGGDGWARPSGEPAGPPHGTPRFESPSPVDPTTLLPPTQTYALPPPPVDLHQPPPPGMGWSGAPSWAFATAAPVANQRKSMTRGWAWTALTLLLLIPVGVALLIAWVVIDEINYEPDPHSQEEWWLLGFAIAGAFLWTGACAVASLISAIIGTVRSRRHPEIRQAPVVAVFVWTFLGLLAAPVVLSVLGGSVGSFLS